MIDFNLNVGHIAHLYDGEQGLVPIMIDKDYQSKEYAQLIIRYRLQPADIPYLRKYIPSAIYKKGMVVFNGVPGWVMYMDQFQDLVWKNDPLATFDVVEMRYY